MRKSLILSTLLFCQSAYAQVYPPNSPMAYEQQFTQQQQANDVVAQQREALVALERLQAQQAVRAGFNDPARVPTVNDFSAR